MTDAIALIAVAVAFAAVVAVVHIEARRMRDELTANRMERAELLQRIQAPHQVAVSPYPFMGGGTMSAQPPAAVDPEDVDETFDREWRNSPESAIPFDEDLALLSDE